ncbi:MAG: lipopolysaccharide heptosyltransferase II [Candidatus Ancaeobacter aquaticus]|nr:lipopolysaccharide heptosyltransferase II [Candidatus Ancaeobacter aquaticus]
MKDKRKKILIVRMDRMGDVLLSTPAIHAVRKQYKDSYIAVLVRPYTVDAVKHNPDIDEVIVYDKEYAHKGMVNNIGFVVHLFMKRFDVALILHSTNRSVLLSFLAGIKKRVGYDRRLKYLLTHPIPYRKHKGEKHEVDYSLELTVLLGVDISQATKKPLFVVSHDDEQFIGTLLQNKGIKRTDRIICIHPGASCPSKRWSFQRFREVVQHYKKRDSVRIVIIGGDEEIDTADSIAQGHEVGVINLAGVLSIGQMGAVLKHSCCLVSNDSGPVHAASALNVPVVVLFGRKNPGLSSQVWGPIGDNNIVLHKDVGCVHCLAHNCKTGFQCLDAITVDDVIGAVNTILEENNGH